MRASQYKAASGSELRTDVSSAGVAIREGSSAKENVFRGFDGFAAEAVFFIAKGAAEKFDDLGRGERIEDIDLGAGEERRDDFKRGILRSCADENDVTGLDMGKKGILLRFVEAVNFVDEDDGAVARADLVLGRGHDFLDFLDARKDGAEWQEIGTREPRDEARKGGFSTTGRAPEKHGAEVVAFDLTAKRLAGPEKFFLADEFIKRARPHALGERLVGGGHAGFRRRYRQFKKEAH